MDGSALQGQLGNEEAESWLIIAWERDKYVSEWVELECVGARRCIHNHETLQQQPVIVLYHGWEAINCNGLTFYLLQVTIIWVEKELHRLSLVPWYMTQTHWKWVFEYLGVGCVNTVTMMVTHGKNTLEILLDGYLISFVKCDGAFDYSIDCCQCLCLLGWWRVAVVFWVELQGMGIDAHWASFKRVYACVQCPWYQIDVVMVQRI